MDGTLLIVHPLNVRLVLCVGQPCFPYASRFSTTYISGTSLPDLFASKQAAQMEATADNSVGNVTGSNSVNVFLGLGLPWTLAAIYHYAVDVSETFLSSVKMYNTSYSWELSY